MDYKVMTEAVKETAIKTGAYIREQGKGFSEEKAESKGTHDLVSYVDKTAEKMIVANLNKLLPEASILAEEGTGKTKQSDNEWIIDPLDGTTNFVNGLFPHSVSIALRVKQETVLGVVYEIGQDECFSAYQNDVARLNGMPIKVSSKTRLDDALIATGFPYNDFSRLQAFTETLSYFMQHTRGIRRFGSAAVDLCYFACGRFDAFFEYSLNPWDVAAGTFIAQQAGGLICDFSGGDNYLFGREIIACTPVLQPAFLGVIKSHLAQ